MMSEKALNARGVTPLGQVVSYGMVAGPDNASLLHQPSRAILKALDRAGKTVADVDLFEINEAFAAVGIASMADLGITDEIVNVNGGAIALGHPIGMSGNRLALTAAARARSPWWRPRRRRPVRRWRSGRRPGRAHRLTGSSPERGRAVTIGVIRHPNRKCLTHMRHRCNLNDT